MLRKYIFLILFCLLSSFAAQSQNVPGYLGKRAMVDYNFNLPYPIYLGPKWTNFIHNINFNYVIKRRAQIGLTLDFFKLYARPEGGNYIINGKKLYSTFKGGTVGINFDWYSKKSIAPVGNYFRLTAKKVFGKYDEYDDFGGLVYTYDGDYDDYAFAVGYGIRRIFFDKMVFNIGGTFEFVIGSLGSEEKERGYQYALASSYYWKFHVGVGVLLF